MLTEQQIEEMENSLEEGVLYEDELGVEYIVENGELYFRCDESLMEVVWTQKDKKDKTSKLLKNKNPNKFQKAADAVDKRIWGHKDRNQGIAKMSGGANIINSKNKKGTLDQKSAEKGRKQMKRGGKQVAKGFGKAAVVGGVVGGVTTAIVKGVKKRKAKKEAMKELASPEFLNSLNESMLHIQTEGTITEMQDYLEEGILYECDFGYQYMVEDGVLHVGNLQEKAPLTSVASKAGKALIARGNKLANSGRKSYQKAADSARLPPNSALHKRGLKKMQKGIDKIKKGEALANAK